MFRFIHTSHLRQFLRGLNTHGIANIGTAMLGLGTSIQLGMATTGVTPALALFHAAPAIASINAGSILLIAVGGILNRYGRPETIISDRPGGVGPSDNAPLPETPEILPPHN